MSSYQPLGSDGLTALWERPDGREHETVSVTWDNEAWTVKGVLPDSDAEYVIRMSPFWQTRQLLLFRDMDEPDLWLGTDGHGRWGEVNGAHRTDLDGVTGLYVDDSVFSLAVAALRLQLGVGDSIEVPLAHIDSETLAVTPTRWWFRRTGEHCWLAEMIDSPGSTSPTDSAVGDGSSPVSRVPPPRLEFVVDTHGIVTDIEGVAQRR